MDSSAGVSVATGADFEIEGTVDFVFFGAEDALQTLCHLFYLIFIKKCALTS